MCIVEYRKEKQAHIYRTYYSQEKILSSIFVQILIRDIVSHQLHCERHS